ncbi:tripartite tricarboxylate transporter TctB family protein [Cereibacter sphaeroides]|uniref:tripartite tricarboxylate transporter TctB family protein n=1 Tax=Cereibacter sphaeroides TaxID=1063 RepID=UPI001F1C7977|nr:tripartite tricarboxylate transporter TctB family protein [Cereibacter sphaeroides]MCE6950564.1 tripartite tricarboxylate transporter TctB family protein [Cereibacter sphaeroides]MCE6959207.1 tripartite tricarboxylate transporter TctB family protein [Cereibacter sphaeroides]MCE6968449.1 tripartite tricarboxylate transporter TctB family protein [Cereibacter sphaeroides]MCE6974132.1 tripartite tricarboxylate transporter TctB family protein [Cereibacter sphaeroides]
MNLRFPEKPRRPDGAAAVIGILLAALGGVMLWEGYRLPQQTGYAGVGPADVPKLVGWCLMALAVWTLADALRGRFEARPRQQIPPVLWIVGGLAAQLILLTAAGFSIASGLLFACTARAFGARRFWVTLPAGFLFALVVYGVFDRLLSLNLPAGLPERLVYGG